jgi:hypothetical protein
LVLPVSGSLGNEPCRKGNRLEESQSTPRSTSRVPHPSTAEHTHRSETSTVPSFESYGPDPTRTAPAYKYSPLRARRPARHSLITRNASLSFRFGSADLHFVICRFEEGEKKKDKPPARGRLTRGYRVPTARGGGRKKKDKARLPGGHRALPDPLFSRADPSRRRAPQGRGSFPPNPELGVRSHQTQLRRSALASCLFRIRGHHLGVIRLVLRVV